MNEQNQRGFSLIEMMVVLLIFALFALTGMSFTNNWITRNRLTEAEDLLLQAYRRTKASALRNQFGVVGDDPAAAMCLTNNILTVRIASTGSIASCQSTIAWTARIHPLLQVKVANTDLSCACLTDKGRLTTHNCSTCISSTQVSLTSGAENADFTFF